MAEEAIGSKIASNKGDPGNAPDYKGAAEATAKANRPTQYTPFGSSTWSQDPSGAWTQNTSLAPGMQGAMNGMQGQLSNAWSTPLDNGATARSNAENAIYGQEASRLDPQWNQREQSMNANLANQGLDPGSAAATATQDQFGRSRNDAYATAQRQAITGGGVEAQRQQQMDLEGRMAPLQGMSGLRGLMQMPGFQPGPNYLAAAGMQGQYQLGSQEARNQMMSDYWNGMMQLGGAIAGAAG